MRREIFKCSPYPQEKKKKKKEAMINNLTEKSDHGWYEAFLQPSGEKKKKQTSVPGVLRYQSNTILFKAMKTVS